MMPKVIHFYFYRTDIETGVMFNWMHFLAVKSARVHNPDYKIMLHRNNVNIIGEWYEYALPYIDEVDVIDYPTEIFGNPVVNICHKVDIRKLQDAVKVGGIYLDLDVLTLNSYDRYLEEDYFIGSETLTRTKVCIAVFGCVPGSRFVTDWLDSYHSFRGRIKDFTYVEHSGVIPARILATGNYPEGKYEGYEKFYKYTVKREKSVELYKSQVAIDFSEIHSLHLWESHSRGIFKTMTFNDIFFKDTSFSHIASPYFEEVLSFPEIYHKIH